MSVTEKLFITIDLLTKKLGERYKAVDKHNDLSIMYDVKHSTLKKSLRSYHVNKYETIYRYVRRYCK